MRIWSPRCQKGVPGVPRDVFLALFGAPLDHLGVPFAPRGHFEATLSHTCGPMCVLMHFMWILASPGLHFESFVSLWGEPEVSGARHCEKFEKVRKMKRLGSSIGSLLGHILRPLPPKIEPTSVLLRSFVSLFSRAFLAVFRSGFLEEIVESRRRPMCVRDSKN